MLKPRPLPARLTRAWSRMTPADRRTVLRKLRQKGGAK